MRGIATGCSLRRLTDRTLAQQFAKDFESECDPFQYALCTRAGIAKALLPFVDDEGQRRTVTQVEGREQGDPSDAVDVLHRHSERSRGSVPFFVGRRKIVHIPR